jgi:hypothetical protein
MHVFALCLETKDPPRNAWASCESYIDFSFMSPRSILATQHSTPMIRIGNDRSPEAMGMHCLLLKALEACRHSNVHIYIYYNYICIYILCNVIHVCVLCIWHVCINMHMHSHIYIYIYMMIQYKLIIIYRIYRLLPKKSPCGSASADVEHSDVPLQV